MITAIRYQTKLLLQHRSTGEQMVVDVETESDRFHAICSKLKEEHGNDWAILEPGPCREVCLIADAG